MDVHSERFGMHFVWDDQKARSNLEKHGISFERACEAFFDPNCVYEDATDNDEPRSVLIGADLANRVLFVVHIELGVRSARLVSAWLATPRERREHEKSR